jgi:hypothetical protein
VARLQTNGDFNMGTHQEDANLILKLYELRREEVMRKARDWYIWFNPTSMQDVLDTFMSDKSAYYRMVTSYWEMAATLVNHGAIDEEMFNEANGEQMVVFAKIEPFLAELRTRFESPQMLANRKARYAQARRERDAERSARAFQTVGSHARGSGEQGTGRIKRVSSSRFQVSRC